LDEVEFNNKYWFPNTMLITVTNPRTEDYKFQTVVQTGMDMTTGRMKEEPRQYRVKAGESERFPGPIANIYLDQMTKLVAQDEEKIHFLIDFSLKAEYYEKLIVSKEDLIQTYEERPEYLAGRVEDVAEAPKEEAFAGAKDKPKAKA
jgi:hypothetical protein